MTLSAGILSPIESVLEDLLVWIHETSSLTWAWSIIALTAIVRLAIFPITAKQTRSSLAMQRLAPYQKQLAAKYKDDRAALNQAVMEFYKDNKVNPLASCLPLLIQIPIFLALFFVLKDFEAPANTSSNFSWLWGFVDDIRTDINDSTSGWILLFVYIASQMLSTVTMMVSPNPQQKWIFLLLPIFFAPFILTFPIGVMLYWITTNLWSLFQYLLVVRFTDTDKEVVLPADSKGRKKVVAPKASNKNQQPSSAAAPPSPVNVRRNKRRK